VVTPARRKWLLATCSLFATLLGLSPHAQGQTPATVDVTVDGRAPGSPLERVWPFYGYDELNYTTSSEGRTLLATLVAAHSAPVHVRSHFWFNSGDGTPGLKWGSTNVYSEDAAGTPVYDWLLTDGILDAITGAGALPFVELGFMPEALSTHPSPYLNSSSKMLDGGSVYPPDDYEKWAALVRSWAEHANQRYPNVAADWLWELWNEPDIGYWQGTFDEYAKLYDYTEAALHQAIPDASLGGPAVAGVGNGFLKKFLEHCATGTNAVSGEAGTRLDLVTFHAKGGVAIVDDHVQMNLGGQLRLHRLGFKSVAAFPQFAQAPIYITEADPDGCAACPESEAPAYRYRNSTAYGAYELAMMKRSLELKAQVGVQLGGILTWAFTFPGTPFFAGYRTLATNGIDLPVLGAFKLLGRVAGASLPLTSSGALSLDEVVTHGVRDQPDIDGMATLNGDRVQVLLWNYHDDLLVAPATPVHLAVTVPTSFGSHVRVSHLRVDEQHGNAYMSWVSQGMPPTPSASQMTALQQAMQPSPLVADRTLPVPEGGAMTFDFELPRFGVSLLTLSPGSANDVESTSSPNPSPSGCACRAHGNQPATSERLALLLVLATVARRRRAASGRPWLGSAGKRGPALPAGSRTPRAAHQDRK
jgi:xylan 1,4-beta-xylosidase